MMQDYHLGCVRVSHEFPDNLRVPEICTYQFGQMVSISIMLYGEVMSSKDIFSLARSELSRLIYTEAYSIEQSVTLILSTSNYGVVRENSTDNGREILCVVNATLEWNVL